ncbi:hypothetical protein PFISCL1PPCAC_9503, partial [Pristionchus fissidentatus]
SPREMAGYDGRRSRSELLQQQQHYMEEPDLDVSSIVTEFAPLDDPFVPYFDAPESEMENDALNAPLECSFASDAGDIGAYYRFRPTGSYAPNTSTPRFNANSSYHSHYQQYSQQQHAAAAAAYASDAPSPPEQLEFARAAPPAGANCSPPTRDAIAEVIGDLQPELIVDNAPARVMEDQRSLKDQFMNSISAMMGDPTIARSVNCFRAKIPKDVPEEALISFLTHCIRWPMRRPLMNLLQARTSALVVEQILKTAMDAQAEPYDAALSRDAYFRITLKNSVDSLNQLHEIVRGISLSQRGFVDVSYSPVRGRVAFLGFNGNLPIRMVQPISSFIECEEEARKQLNAQFSAEITLSRCGDDLREVNITYFDTVETHPKTGRTVRVTEVNVYHIIHRVRSRVNFAPPSAPAKQHEFPVAGPMMSLSHMLEQTYTLGECFQLSRSYPQHKW